jgi:MFS family permease
VSSDGSRASSPTGVRRLFRALYARNYRLYFGGQSLSVTGSWMQRMALSWWVYRGTHATLMLGGVGCAGQLPALLLAPVAGALVDRWGRHRLLIVTQTLAMLQAFVLAWLVLAGLATLWPLLLVSALLGVINAVDMPARQALLVDLVDQPEDLGNALALNAAMTNGARLVGPSLAGLVIVHGGEGLCFLLNGLSYLAILPALGAMRLPPRHPAPPRAPVLTEARDGVRYAWGLAPLRAILLLVSAVNLLGMPYQVLLPVFATDILQGNAHTLGRLAAAAGVGAILGALALMVRDSVRGLGHLLVLATSLFSLGLIGLSFARTEGMALLALVGASGGMMMLTTASNTLLQTMVEEDKRGRIMSLYTLAFVGMAPIGSLVAGSVAGQIGAPQTVRIGGVCCLLGAVVFARHLPTLRALLQPLSANKERLQEARIQTRRTLEAYLHAHH